MSLIEQIYAATQSGALTQPFTTAQMKVWMESASIVKDDGSKYAEASIDAILSNSDLANRPTTNKNIKILHSKLTAHGEKRCV